ncbi:MAG: hypothetical protein A3D92_02340 [Bacteroidetes bacterium RIFCSPHIGHO2_02_FULL_44_7]|nr:MAG: hypothetical protein A3D92_02340 [Bacteroidetes bacterium RIFCSPHIGHO2_02_FULL_44_7]
MTAHYDSIAHTLFTQENFPKFCKNGYLTLIVSSLPGKYNIGLGEINDASLNPGDDVLGNFTLCVKNGEFREIPKDMTLEDIAEAELSSLGDSRQYFFAIVGRNLYRCAETHCILKD